MFLKKLEHVDTWAIMLDADRLPDKTGGLSLIKSKFRKALKTGTSDLASQDPICPLWVARIGGEPLKKVSGFQEVPEFLIGGKRLVEERRRSNGSHSTTRPGLMK